MTELLDKRQFTPAFTRDDALDDAEELLARTRRADRLLRDLDDEIGEMKKRGGMTSAAQVALSTARDHLGSSWRALQYALQALEEILHN